MARPWGDRPSLIAAVLALIGLGVAGYLTYIHYEGIAPVCSTGGCERVQASSYSEIAGIPVALLGLIGYLGIGASLLLPGDAGRALTFTLTLIGFGFSTYLTYLELFVIDAICQWCVASAVVMTALLVVATFRLLGTEPGPGGPPEP
jgi:uncharacterized membrane protein